MLLVNYDSRTKEMKSTYTNLEYKNIKETGRQIMTN